MKKAWLSFLLGGLLLVGCSKSPTDPAPVLYYDMPVGVDARMTTTPSVEIKYLVTTPVPESVDITYTNANGADTKITAQTPWRLALVFAPGARLPQAGISAVHNINPNNYYRLSQTPISVTLYKNLVIQAEDTDTFMAQAIIFFKKAY